MLNIVARNAVQTCKTPMSVQVRNMATLKEIQQRLKSVQNIEKITKSMKMIASTKVSKAQRSMESARVFGEASNSLFTNAETKATEAGKTLYIASSSDRGLCGGIHSSVSKATRRAIAEQPESNLIVLGDKPKAQLGRILRKNIALTFNQIGKDVPTFEEASSIVDIIKSSETEFDTAHIVYNKFNSVVSYEANILPVYSESSFKASPNFAVYEIEDDVLANLQEFAFANTLYWAMVEGHAAEMCAKRAAMENATKNAGEMIQKLTMTFNRGRQAVITNELIDIITGASAL
ncbi:ATP synthase F1, gamma subunit [Cokeromyces recurvatus]|uniref:ATP synthase F1, gamma subunit n=1 Tax=Cokeromyces recurvatus TaxID=90255 RepID=UPI002220C71E|nr:ATP synthase F1, gamma subunit [Cokeromyces recurvatus]KAI7903964.1 ATP synthase F1, gamma subunit [Cokeromyces recurvatus]